MIRPSLSENTAANDYAKLVVVELPKPYIKETTPTYVELHTTDTDSVIKTSTATWARIYNGAVEVW